MLSCRNIYNFSPTVHVISNSIHVYARVNNTTNNSITGFVQIYKDDENNVFNITNFTVKINGVTLPFSEQNGAYYAVINFGYYANGTVFNLFISGTADTVPFNIFKSLEAPGYMYLAEFAAPSSFDVYDGEEFFYI